MARLNPSIHFNTPKSPSIRAKRFSYLATASAAFRAFSSLAPASFTARRRPQISSYSWAQCTIFAGSSATRLARTVIIETTPHFSSRNRVVIRMYKRRAKFSKEGHLRSSLPAGYPNCSLFNPQRLHQLQKIFRLKPQQLGGGGAVTVGRGKSFQE
jgi:hypothetical protein